MAPRLEYFDSRDDFNKWYREYFRSVKWKKYHRDYLRLWRAKNGTSKDKIRKKVFRAVLEGKLKKTLCWCGAATAEAHHQDYRRHLDVMWLCRKHHREADVKEGRRKY